MPVLPFSARNARVLVDTTPLLACKWSVIMRVTEADTTTADAPGQVPDPKDPFAVAVNNVYTYRIPDTYDAEITIEGYWDANSNPFVAPPLVLPGQELTDVYLFLDYYGTASLDANSTSNFNDEVQSLAWHFPQVLVCQATMDAEVRGILKLSLTCKNQGVFYPPT